MTQNTNSRTGEPGLTDQSTGTATGEEHIQEMGAEEVEARNREIYRRKQEGVIQSQLAREYGLSPEWIRRICEDQERLTVKSVNHSFSVSEADKLLSAKMARPVITVYDLCGICTDGQAEIQLWSAEPGAEKRLFSGTVQGAMGSEYAHGIIVSCSLDAAGVRLNIDAGNR